MLHRNDVVMIGAGHSWDTEIDGLSTLNGNHDLIELNATYHKPDFQGRWPKCGTPSDAEWVLVRLAVVKGGPIRPCGRCFR